MISSQVGDWKGDRTHRRPITTKHQVETPTFQERTRHILVRPAHEAQSETDVILELCRIDARWSFGS